ncbi:MAG: peptide-methionine (S)-S-oxide reductase [Cycloclasticus sp. symbiont of Bathymodiolus heckerae]|nr:MAG: peptide-methionine (S)-S-oxide reductase [Cycloclasticus sp. symbiont of Bathymodiolus heckerae]
MTVLSEKINMPTQQQALPGRSEALCVPTSHFVYRDHTLSPPFPGKNETAVFGLGCFWGAERKFWLLDGVYSTAVGYTAGFTPNPTYEEVCSGKTGHNEVVLVVYDPAIISYEALLKVFWESHNPTQGMGQGNDRGTQFYYESDSEKVLAEQTRAVFQMGLSAAEYGAITTEILPAPLFYYAEHYHQQYLAKNPAGYCGLGGTSITLGPL